MSILSGYSGLLGSSCVRLPAETAYPRDEIEKTWRNVLLYDEHTWGAHCSITQPDSEFTKAQWKIKAQFANQADGSSRSLYQAGIGAVASPVRTSERAIVVFNPCGWARTEVICVTVPRELTIAAPDVPTWDRAGSAAVRLVYALVKDVPAFGYRVLKLGPAAALKPAQALEGNTIESRQYRVTFDPATGAISSILDKDSGRELADARAAHRINQCLYVSGGDGTRIVDERRPLQAALSLSTSGKATPDAPLACFQDINRGKWQTKLAFANGYIYAYVMNNYWWTNYLAGQGGDYTFRFSMTSRPKSDLVASARFGWEVSNPLVAEIVEANPSGPLKGPSGSLVSIDEPNVMLIGA